jgi:hypothetical protein
MANAKVLITSHDQQMAELAKMSTKEITRALVLEEVSEAKRVLALLAKEAEILATKATEAKKRHDRMVDTLQDLRDDLGDISKLEKRGRKSSADDSAEVSADITEGDVTGS